MATKTARLFASLVLTATLPASAPAQQTAGPEGDVAEIARLIESVQAANNAGDVEAWVALFARDAVYMPPSAETVSTRDELVEVARAGFRHAADVDIEPHEIRVLGDWAFARTRVSGTITLDGTGETIPIDVKQLVVYRREDGMWRIARMISNSNP